jgi:hypothetical protein
MPSISRPAPPSGAGFFSPRADVLIVLGLFFLPFLLPGVAILGRDGLLGADLPEFHLPHQQFIYSLMREGTIPFWNPFAYGGAPEFGNPEMAPMYPPVLFPLLLFGPAMMLKIKFLIHLGLLGAGCFLLLRQYSLPLWLAALAALTLEASGFPITKIALPNVGDSAAWAPWLLCLNLGFSRRPTLLRGLVYALFGGCTLLLFFPQITVTLLLLLVLAGAARFVKCHAVRLRSEYRLQPALWIHGLLLPLAELAVVAALLRYPPQPTRFPEPGWRCAFQGMGAMGVVSLLLVAFLWAGWLWARRLRVRIEWKGAWRWAAGFGGVWLLAAAFAAPQLAVTGELIVHSTQSALRYEKDEDYFTGAQAYGSVRDFLETSALARRKESVNNMALGPVVYLLALAGLLGGFHRRHRHFLFFTAGAVLTGAIYMAAPGVFDVFRRLPFFGKFAGLSRYLAFLNLFLVLMAALAAQFWIRRAPARFKGAARSLVAIGFLVNLAFLGYHQLGYWRELRAAVRFRIPPSIAQKVRASVSPEERILVDARDRDEFVPLLMFSLVERMPGLAGYGPMRLGNYDSWLRAHNASLGVAHDDYRAALLEPTPSPWTRAMRVRGFLYPPGARPGIGTEEAADSLVTAWEHEGWRLMIDREIPPPAWPENDLQRRPPVPRIPSRWNAALIWEEMNRLELAIENPGEAGWAVVSLPRYPGWKAWVNGLPSETASAYGFLTAVRVPAGKSVVDLEYRPRSFAAGWLCFLMAVWVWLVLFGLARLRAAGPVGRATPKRFLIAAISGALPLCGVAAGLWAGPLDSLLMRVAELSALAALALLAARWAGAGGVSPASGRG